MTDLAYYRQCHVDNVKLRAELAGYRERIAEVLKKASESEQWILGQSDMYLQCEDGGICIARVRALREACDIIEGPTNTGETTDD